MTAMFIEGEARTLSAGNELLDYTLKRTRRRRTVGIFVEPDRRLTVFAPADAELEKVERLLRRRLPWVRRQRRALEALPAPSPPRQWVNAETHRYLGRQYRLKLMAGADRSVKLAGGYFKVTLPDSKDRAAVRRLMEAWYRGRARALIVQRARRIVAATSWLDVTELPPIAIKALTHRWGSTTRAGRITFNVDVVKLPLACLDYVIAHELVHLRIPNHSPAYWRMLGRVMPDWERWRERLGRVEV
jgi:predicted metal-dependent hydrolase